MDDAVGIELDMAPGVQQGIQLDVRLHDEELVDEIRLVTELMVVATLAPGELEQQVIDDTLGVVPVRSFFPRQRRAV